jgi:hypothetical protein
MRSLLLCLKIVTVNPAFVTSDIPGQKGSIVRGDWMKLLTDIDTLLLLISCQIPGHKFGGNMIHAPFSIQNLSAFPITNSAFLMNELLMLSGVVKLMALYECCRLSWISSPP